MNQAAESVKCMPSRERYWEEADSEAKIERLRDEVARLCRLVTEQAETIVKLSIHRHTPENGELLVPMVRGNQPLGYFAHDNGIPHSLRKPHERRDR